MATGDEGVFVARCDVFPLCSLKSPCVFSEVAVPSRFLEHKSLSVGISHAQLHFLFVFHIITTSPMVPKHEKPHDDQQTDR